MAERARIEKNNFELSPKSFLGNIPRPDSELPEVDHNFSRFSKSFTLLLSIGACLEKSLPKINLSRNFKGARMLLILKIFLREKNNALNKLQIRFKVIFFTILLLF